MSKRRRGLETPEEQAAREQRLSTLRARARGLLPPSLLDALNENVLEHLLSLLTLQSQGRMRRVNQPLHRLIREQWERELVQQVHTLGVILERWDMA